MGIIYQRIGENCAKASGLFLPISAKHSIEICSFIRDKSLIKAKQMLEDVIAFRRAVPFKRFKCDMGHKKGPIAAGRYPIKACSEILRLLKSAEANAVNKGLKLENLFVALIMANLGPRNPRHGRKGNVVSKRAHVCVVLEERQEKEKRKNRIVKK